MEIDVLRSGLVNCLEQFDTAILPLGLYASDELSKARPIKASYQEWDGAILPFLANHNCISWGFSPLDNFLSQTTCFVPDIGKVGIALVKISNIKVRKYGSGYQVDKQEDRLGRWEKAGLSGQLSQMWNQSDRWAGNPPDKARIVLFIGFDKTPRPFERELEQLRESNKWENHAVSYQTQIWEDKAERGFNIRLCAWSRVSDL